MKIEVIRDDDWLQDPCPNDLKIIVDEAYRDSESDVINIEIVTSKSKYMFGKPPKSYMEAYQKVILEVFY